MIASHDCDLELVVGGELDLGGFVNKTGVWGPEPDGEALYLRLSTKPIDQGPFAAAEALVGDEQLRVDVVVGGFRLREPGIADDRVVIAACGAIVPEALAAAALLAEEEGVEAAVLCLSSPDRLYRSWQASRAARLKGPAAEASHLERLLRPEERDLPVVTVIDGASPCARLRRQRRSRSSRESAGDGPDLSRPREHLGQLDCEAKRRRFVPVR